MKNNKKTTELIIFLKSKREKILKKIPSINSEILKGFMKEDLKKINEDIKLWKIRSKFVKNKKSLNLKVKQKEVNKMINENITQKDLDINLLKILPIKNIQISYLGCYIVVFDISPQQAINFFKKKGYIIYKNGVYHRITNNKDFYTEVTNRRNIYFTKHIGKETLEELNLLNKYLKTEEEVLKEGSQND